MKNISVLIWEVEKETGNYLTIANPILVETMEEALAEVECAKKRVVFKNGKVILKYEIY